MALNLSQRQQVKQTTQKIEQASESILDLIAPASLKIGPNYLQLNEYFVRTLFVFTYPRFLQTNWLSPAINYDVIMDISLHITPLESRMFVEHLRKQQGRLESSRQIEQEKGLVRNPELDTALTDIDQLREELQTSQQRIFQTGLYFTIYAKTLEELNTVTDQLESALGGQLIYTKQAIYQTEQGLNTALPLGLDELKIARNLDTRSLSTAFPFVSATLSNNEGVFYGINKHNNSLILFDRFNLENANMAVFGTSGSGKSFCVKLEALRSLMLGTDILVIDPEREYEPLAGAVGGSYFEMSLNSQKRINPFDLPQGQTDESGDVILRTKAADLTSLIAMMVGGTTPEETAIVDRALYQTYALRDITTDIRTHKNPPPLLGDFVAVLQGVEGTHSLVARLQKFTEGSFAGLFNQPTNFELDRGFVAFSIRDLEEQLRPIGMYLILSYVWSKIRQIMRPRVLIIDEAWILMQYPDSAKYVRSFVKRARKYYLGVTIISQNVEDFLGSAEGRDVLANSALQILFRQSPTAVEQLAQVFHLTEGEKFLLLESQVGEGLFFAGNSHVAMQVIASYPEEQIITTSPRELLAQKTKAEQAGGPVISAQPAPATEPATPPYQGAPAAQPPASAATQTPQQTGYQPIPAK